MFFVGLLGYPISRHPLSVSPCSSASWIPVFIPACHLPRAARIKVYINRR